MTKRVRVNIRSLANSAGIVRETRNGREVIVVPSATLPDDVVMNGILYPKEEIANSFGSLSRTPAPLGHPQVNGKFVSASDPEGINVGYIGAWNDNVRRENGRVYLDKVIDVAKAQESEGGKAVLNAIEKGEPIHTSTGLLCNLENDDCDDHKHIARNIHFDHDAILLNDEGAATPEQGVGMFVNSNGDEMDVINSALEDADRELDWAVDHLARALERHERVPMLERIKAALIEAFASERKPSANTGDADMADTKQHEELSAKVNSLTETVDGLVKGLPDMIKNAVKPLTENLETMQANQAAKDEAELAGYVATIVAANILDEESAKELTLNSAKKLAEKAKPGKAAALNGATGDSDKDEFADFDLNKIGEEK